MAEPFTVDDAVEANPLGLVVQTGTGPATITFIAEPDSIVLAVSGPGFAHDYRLPFEAWDRLLEAVADARLLARPLVEG